MQETEVFHPSRVVCWLQRLTTAAIFLLLVFLPVSPAVGLPFWLPGAGEFLSRGPSLSMPPILTLAVVALGTLQYFLSASRRPLSLGPAPLAVPVIALAVLGLATVPLSIDPAHSFSSSLYHLLLLALYLVAVNVPVERWAIAAGLAVGAVIQASIGWPQFLLGHSLGLQVLGEYAVDASSPGVSVVMMGESRLLRAYGLTGHPNQLGGYLMFSIPVVVGYLLHGFGKRHFPLLLSTATVISLSGLLVTFSRAAWLGLAVSGATIFLLLRKRLGIAASASTPTRLILAAAVLVVVAFGASNWQPLLGRLGAASYATETQSIEERGNLNGLAWQLIAQRPITGVGLGNFNQGASLLLPEQAADFPGMTVHNVALLAAAEAGFLGGLIWIYLMVAPWSGLWRTRSGPLVTPWSAGLYASVAGLAVLSMFDYYLWCTLRGGVMLWLAWGLLAREWVESRAVTQGSRRHQAGPGGN